MIPLVFRCGPDRLVGTLHPPADNGLMCDGKRRRQPGIVFLVGGPQTRSGAARGLRHLAESLSAGGIHVLRFDWRGEGDSEGLRRPFDARGAEISMAMATLRKTSAQLGPIFLLGLCDGASAALLHAGQVAGRSDGSQVPAGLILVNPWMRDDDLRPPLGSPGWLPIALPAGLRRMQGAAGWELERRLNEAARRARLPTLWLAARQDPTGRDALIRLRSTRWRELRRRPSRLLSWTGDDHILARPETRLRLVTWIRQWIEEQEAARRDPCARNRRLPSPPSGKR